MLVFCETRINDVVLKLFYFFMDYRSCHLEFYNNGYCFTI